MCGTVERTSLLAAVHTCTPPNEAAGGWVLADMQLNCAIRSAEAIGQGYIFIVASTDNKHNVLCHTACAMNMFRLCTVGV